MDLMNEIRKMLFKPLLDPIYEVMDSAVETLVIGRHTVELVSEITGDSSLIEEYDAKFTNTVDRYNGKLAQMSLEDISEYLMSKRREANV